MLRTGGGRASVRAVPFMGAITAARHNATLKAFHQRLIDTGKPRLVAIVAIARQMLTIRNAIMRSQQACTSDVQAASIWLPHRGRETGVAQGRSCQGRGRAATALNRTGIPASITRQNDH